ncbi:hemerythrin domain-containing protein [Neptunomonas antarctica]|uniref:Hemerythrin-like domain-containing protein n=1 Tax=Neptunomonas antarctica TaxID=619304 RepID=A0A1N7L5H2_9GAMM|nr:hemerythrin domain-containing protein [Neptunomonas antarctica]SIS69041.1 hypothetical protein SAMN05421760_103246 [Neptunomonas antarctica]
MKRCIKLQPLSREHHQALVFSKRLRALDDLPVDSRHEHWQALKPLLIESLYPHFEEEERYFLQDLGVESDNDLIRHMLADHQMIRNFIESDSLDQCGIFSDLLKAHVRFEERELFPWLEVTFSLR